MVGRWEQNFVSQSGQEAERDEGQGELLSPMTPAPSRPSHLSTKPLAGTKPLARESVWGTLDQTSSPSANTCFKAFKQFQKGTVHLDKSFYISH